MAERKRRDSLSGKMKRIAGLGSSLKALKKRSLVGLGFYSKSKGRTKGVEKVQKKRDEMDDIEILEQIVTERVDFDWAEFEHQRQQSLYLKQQELDALAKKRSSAPVFQEVSVPSNLPKSLEETGKVVIEEDDAESVSGNNREPSQIIDLNAKDPLTNISGEGKEKLKFITEFAKKVENEPSPSADADYPVDAKSLITRNALRKSKLNTQKRFRNASKKGSLRRNSQSCPPGKGNETDLIGTRATQMTKKERLEMAKSKEVTDQFARYQGYRDAKHMQQYLERMRGFEELRNETQIDLMARENGYRPDRNCRFRSVLSHLDVALGKGNVVNDIGSDSENDDLKSDNESVDINNDILQFMDADDDDLLKLSKQWDKMDGFKKDKFGDESEDEKEPHSGLSSEQVVSVKRKEERRKMAIRKGWERMKDSSCEERVKPRRKVNDSLTLKDLGKANLFGVSV